MRNYSEEWSKVDTPRRSQMIKKTELKGQENGDSEPPLVHKEVLNFNKSAKKVLHNFFNFDKKKNFNCTIFYIQPTVLGQRALQKHQTWHEPVDHFIC